jgi:uncharacterized membrane protein
MIKDKAMPRTVHWLQPKLLLLYLKSEHILFVISSMAGCFPQLHVEHVWRHHLLIASFLVFTTDESL